MSSASTLIARMPGNENAPAVRIHPGARPNGGKSVDKAEPPPRQRQPYNRASAKRSYEERLARRAEPRPLCKCGCGTRTRWLTSKGRWAVYAQGHYRQAAPYKDEAWLRTQYEVERRTFDEIAAECGVYGTTVIKQARKFGIEPRGRSEARLGRMVGPKNPAWKGGVAEWEYSSDWKALARRIRDRDEWTCQDCGERRKRWGHSLHVHHIDGNKLNNDEGNLISLCATCHRQAHREGVI
jgi:hypothetical protein